MDENNSIDQSIPLEGGALDEHGAKSVIEALMIATTEPLPLKNIAEIVSVPETAVRAYIDELNQDYREAARAFEIKEIAGGFQIYTLPKYAQWVGALHERKERLSKAALETLAIIAYHQPIIRPDLEKIRGVDSSYILDKLLEKNLIKTCGRLPSPGRPIKYGTTREFLRYFGINDISELPKEEDFSAAVMGGYPEMSSSVPVEPAKDDVPQDDDENEDEDEDLRGGDEPRGETADSEEDNEHFDL